MDLGFDFDGVIGDCGDLKKRRIKKMFNLDVTLEECTRKKITSMGITHEQYDQLLSSIYDTDIAYEIGEIDGAINAIKKLKQEGHYVKIVTSRFSNSGKMVEKWLSDRGIVIPVICTNKTSKGPYCRGLDLFVDDEHHKLELVKSTVDNLFLFSTPYNLDDKVDWNIKRVNSWDDLYLEIQRMKIGYDHLSR